MKKLKSLVYVGALSEDQQAVAQMAEGVIKTISSHPFPGLDWLDVTRKYNPLIRDLKKSFKKAFKTTVGKIVRDQAHYFNLKTHLEDKYDMRFRSSTQKNLPIEKERFKYALTVEMAILLSEGEPVLYDFQVRFIPLWLLLHAFQCWEMRDQKLYDWSLGIMNEVMETDLDDIDKIIEYMGQWTAEHQNEITAQLRDNREYRAKKRWAKRVCRDKLIAKDLKLGNFMRNCTVDGLLSDSYEDMLLATATNYRLPLKQIRQRATEIGLTCEVFDNDKHNLVALNGVSGDNYYEAIKYEYKHMHDDKPKKGYTLRKPSYKKRFARFRDKKTPQEEEYFLPKEEKVVYDKITYIDGWGYYADKKWEAFKTKEIVVDYASQLLEANFEYIMSEDRPSESVVQRDKTAESSPVVNIDDVKDEILNSNISSQRQADGRSYYYDDPGNHLDEIFGTSDSDDNAGRNVNHFRTTYIDPTEAFASLV